MERPMIRRTFIRFLFWALILYTAISATVVLGIQFGLIPVPPRKTAAADNLAAQKEQDATLSERAFAERFVREYFFWTKGKESSRAERLNPFLKRDMDVQAGLDFKKADWESYARYVVAWDIKERTDRSGIKEVTVFAETILSKVGNAKLQKRVDRYMVVPIKKVGNSYLVADTPFLVAPPVPSSTQLPDEQEEENQGEAVDETVRGQVETFMKSFWKVYTTGEPQEIAYFQKNSPSTAGLKDILQFIDLKNLSVRKKDNIYVVKCDVRLKDLSSGAEMAYHYTFDLVQEGDRWYVVRMGQGEI
ncbi:conjugal transfer protein [Laceyella putida]|uniref:Conjugal transfer protein n=1 Tax=Laceyella putida TaxID=110101 RepID=A0ABW2RQC8_9BACL